jgi:hypothetical protein
MRRFCASRLGFVLAVLCAAIAPTVQAAQIDLEIAAYEGQAAPGIPGAVFDVLAYETGDNTPAVSESGHAVFRGRLVLGPGGVTNANRVGLWVRSPDGHRTLVARQGDPIPGDSAGLRLHDTNHTQSGVISIDRQGRVAFAWRIADTIDPLRFGIFGPVGASGLGTLALDNLPLAGAGPDFASLPVDQASKAPLIDDTGRVLGFTSLGSATALWQTDASGGTAVLVLTGDNAPGLPGEHIQWILGAWINGAGDVAFSATLSPTDERRAWWISDGDGGWHLFAVEGDTAEGIPDASYSWINFLGMTDHREAYVRASLEGVTPCGDLLYECSALYRVDRSGEMSLLYRAGDPVPGGATGEILLEIDLTANELGLMAGAGRIRSGPIEDPASDRIVLFGPDGLGVAVRATQNQQAAGLPVGTMYRDFSRIELNNRGEVVFWSRLEPTQLGQPVKGGIFFIDASGQVQPVAYRNLRLSVAPGDERTVDFVPRPAGFVPYEGRSFFTDSGAFGFPVRFTDGTDAIVVAKVRRERCGLGAELAPLLPIVALFRRRTQDPTARRDVPAA